MHSTPCRASVTPPEPRGCATLEAVYSAQRTHSPYRPPACAASHS
jgi:hypothetical protein